MNLFEIAEEYKASLELFDSEEDIDYEKADILQDWHNETRESLDKKLLAYAYTVKNIESEVDFIKNIIKKLQKKVKTKESRSEWLRSKSFMVMESLNIKKVSDLLFSLTVKDNSRPKLNIIDASEIIFDYWYSPPAEVDNEKLKNALIEAKKYNDKLKELIKKGENVEPKFIEIKGAELIYGKSLQIK